MKINKEKDIVKTMIAMYSKGHDKVPFDENKEMQNLYAYCQLKLSKCPFKDKKKFCSNCTIHCYEITRRNQIKKVMKYSGPRMIFKHPILLIKHCLQKKG